ncbi:hypothetical protein B9Z19DRAFT_1069936 [Tuber borchii]|uniref:Uncharacterized protein n=1 Tax=Tuber borchii TaxID=42251 RepID=A0A2T6Z9X7_TUBBO|nr:hypothetical protein B9Z19DRAFT_1069936 [Tuber borchii]
MMGENQLEEGPEAVQNLFLQMAGEEIAHPLRTDRLWRISEADIEYGSSESEGNMERKELQNIKAAEKKLEEKRFELYVRRKLRKSGKILVDRDIYEAMMKEKEEAIADRQILAMELEELGKKVGEKEQDLVSLKERLREVEREVEKEMRQKEESQKRVKELEERGSPVDKIVEKANRIIEEKGGNEVKITVDNSFNNKEKLKQEILLVARWIASNIVTQQPKIKVIFGNSQVVKEEIEEITMGNSSDRERFLPVYIVKSI